MRPILYPPSKLGSQICVTGLYCNEQNYSAEGTSSAVDVLLQQLEMLLYQAQCHATAAPFRCKQAA